MAGSETGNTTVYVPWNVDIPFLTPEEQDVLSSYFLPWIIFVSASCILTLLFGIGACIYRFKFKGSFFYKPPPTIYSHDAKPLLDNEGDHSNEDDKDDESTRYSVNETAPSVYLNHSQAIELKRLVRQRRATFLLVFCILILFTSLTIFMFFIDERAIQNVSTARSEITTCIELYTLLITEAYDDFGVLVNTGENIQQPIEKLKDAFTIANDQIRHLIDNTQSSDTWRHLVTIALHSASILVLLFLIFGAFHRKLLTIFVLLSFPVLITFWLSCTLNSLSYTALSYSCLILNQIESNYTSQYNISASNNSAIAPFFPPSDNSSICYEMLTDCVAYGYISPRVQNVTGLLSVVASSNASLQKITTELNAQLKNLSLSDYAINGSYLASIQIGESQTLAASLAAINYTQMELQRLELYITSPSSNLTQTQLRNLQTNCDALGSYLRGIGDVVTLANCSSAAEVWETSIQDLLCMQVGIDIQWLGMAALACGICFVALMFFSLVLNVKYQQIPATLSAFAGIKKDEQT